MKRALAVMAGAVGLVFISACQAPFGLGEPSTRALETGIVNSLAAATSLEVTGPYSEAGGQWSMDLQLVRPGTQHIVVSNADLKLEAAIFVDPTGFNVTEAYFRGNQFLSQHMGPDPASRNLVKAAGNAWWKGTAGQVPQLSNFTDGASFESTFLGTSVTKRVDHVVVDGLDAVSLSGSRAEVFVAAGTPHQLLRVRLQKGATVDGVSDANFQYANFDKDFKIAKPTDVIDFSNLSTLPPIYTVVSVDTSRCGSTCVVSAVVKNLGGKLGAQAPSTVTFTMTDPAAKLTIGTCSSEIKPDVGYNTTRTVSCTIPVTGGQQTNAAVVTAAPTNPGRA